MSDEVRFNLDESTITVFLNDPAGPVGDMLGELADQGANRARALAPVRTGTLWNDSATLTSNARPPGFLKGSIHGKRGVSRRGKLYGSINAEANPLVFVAYPAQQVHFKNIFMTTALYSINV
jgi:hypothetical protein